MGWDSQTVERWLGAQRVSKDIYCVDLWLPLWLKFKTCELFYTVLEHTIHDAPCL